METWGEGLESVYDYIISICQLPHLAKRLDIDGPFSHSEILAIYKEWLWLLARLDHPTEQGFFKASWFPLSKKEYSYYFDLNAHDLIVFEPQYFFPIGASKVGGHWDVNPFMVSLQELKEIQIENDGGEAWLKDLNDQLHMLFLARIRSLNKEDLESDFDPQPVGRYSLLKDKDAKPEVVRGFGRLEVSNVNSIIIGLLPWELEIIDITTLESPNFENIFVEVEDKSILKNIKKLARYVSSIGHGNVSQLIFTFKTVKGRKAKVVFKEGVFRIKARDRGLLERLEQDILEINKQDFPF